jgi:hypothetical protein
MSPTFLTRKLTPAEQEAVGKALEAQFGKPATYDPTLGGVEINRPGGLRR